MKVRHLRMIHDSYSLIDFYVLGNVDDDIVFTYETDTEVFKSCAATLNGEFWVLGGYYQSRQVVLKESKTESQI